MAKEEAHIERRQLGRHAGPLRAMKANMYPERVLVALGGSGVTRIVIEKRGQSICQSNCKFVLMLR